MTEVRATRASSGLRIASAWRLKRSHSLRGERRDGPRRRILLDVSALPVHDVVSGQRDSVDLLAQLNLKIKQAAVTEGRLAARERDRIPTSDRIVRRRVQQHARGSR